jgi:hypothetical protein
MKARPVLLRALISVSIATGIASAQTGSITGTVKDPSGAAVVGANVIVASPEHGIRRQMLTNSTGEYNESALPAGRYDVSVTAGGFKRFEAKGVTLDVAQKARVDVTLQVGTATTEVIVQGENVAQVETESSELSGVVTGKEITQLELNGRDFKQLVTLVPGVSNQTGSDEGGVGVTATTSFSVNGGRVEYNNWELDGGDNMDNGSNNTLNVTPSIDAIGEFKVLTSNYGAQYGRNGSGTIEVETKSGTKAFHGDAYEFLRNDAFNADNYFNSVYRGGTGTVPEYKKNDFGYTIGGPVYIPGVYNQRKEKTFFFWSEDWRRELVPATFLTPVPYSAERTGNFNDVCPNPQSGSYIDCPVNPTTGSYFTNNQVPVDPAATAMLPLVPVATSDVPGAAYYNANLTQPTYWREELVKIDHNLTDHERAMFRYIHDSWNQVDIPTLWTGASFPTTQTYFNGPGISMVARFTSTISPTLLNEFVASYTTDHLAFKSQGIWQRPANLPMGSLYNNGFDGKLPDISVSGGVAYGGGFYIDPDGELPEGPYNSNPTYTYRDSVTKVIGRHNLQFGAYFVAAQKNELSQLSTNGSLTFDISTASVTLPNGQALGTGNAFADMLMGNIASYSQGSNDIKFYNRYKILEPYFQDDWRITDRLTLNLGLRVSLEGTYRDRYMHAYNWDPSVYNVANAPFIYDSNGNAPLNVPAGASLTGTPGALVTDASNNVIGNPLEGLVVCGTSGGAVTLPGSPSATVGGTPHPGCMSGHLFNPAPRVGFAYDLFGDGKTAIRGGYGIFFEHANGNEANTEGMEGQTSPLLQTETQNNVQGYLNIGSSGGSFAPAFPASFLSIPDNAVWPYVQQWHLDIQRELLAHTVMTVAYVGAKGTHLGDQRDMNQLYPLSPAQNPYHPGQPIMPNDCNSLTNIGDPDVSGVINGQTYAGQVAINLQTACGNSADPYRPFYGMHTITRLENEANSSYHALQVAARKSVGALNLTLAYTYSHSIDDSSDRYDGSFVNSYNLEQTRASSTYDQRHLLNIAWVYDLPFFRKRGLSHSLLGGWQWSGIETFYTGTPSSVTNGTTYGDNAGVGNGVGTGSFADRTGDPNANIPGIGELSSTSYSKYALNPGAYALPTGLTFGNSGRDSVNGPARLNFDTGIFKHFAIKEQTAFEFRVEAFNVFNHTEWGGFSTSMSCPNPGTAATNSAGDPSCLGPGGANLFQINWAHNPRILQLSAKLIF